MEYDIIKRLILDSDNVIITSHKNIDFDALGSMLGMYYITQSFDKKSYIVIDDKSLSHEVQRAIDAVIKKENICICTYDEVKKEINDKTLLVITDVNIEKRIQNKKLLSIKNIMLFDHHVLSDDKLDSKYSYVCEEASSSNELALELIEKLNVYIPSTTAVIMLAGIYVDTHGFIKNTTDKTHYYTSLLYKFGIDLKEAQSFIKQDFKEYKRRKELVIAANILDGMAITTSNDIFEPYELAMVSNELLVFDEVKASFTIAKLDDTTIGISARSLGDIDVEKIMALFGGGGHTNEAAAQLKGNINEIKNKIISYWREMHESNIHKGC